MAAAAASSPFRSPSHFAYSFPFNRQLPKLGNPVLSLTESAIRRTTFEVSHLKRWLINLAENAYKSMPFNSHKPSISSIESDGNTKGSRCRKGFTYALGRKNDGSEESSNGIKPLDSSSREEIVALFRKIQSSIAKAETQRAKTKSFNSSNDKSTTESVMHVLQKSGKNLQDFADTGTKKGAKALRWRSGNPKKRQGKEKAPAAMEEFNLSRSPSNFMKRSPIPHPTAPRTKTPEWKIESVATNEGSELANIEKLKDFNLSRPPSNFMKKSPILHPTAPRTRTTEENFEAVSADEGSALANIEKLKLSEFKELAKARGIKGYSKLKKSELLQLLIPWEKSK